MSSAAVSAGSTSRARTNRWKSSDGGSGSLLRGGGGMEPGIVFIDRRDGNTKDEALVARPWRCHTRH
jgi:hypothetical protein